MNSKVIDMLRESDSVPPFLFFHLTFLTINIAFIFYPGFHLHGNLFSYI